MTVKTRKKLIEIALPLEAINLAAKEEKAVPRHGHPQTLHYWWARRPLAAARAVIFAQMVDDPSEYMDTLRSDPALRRKAESALKSRKKLWEEATALAAKVKGTKLSAPEPGPAPTLDETLADVERQRLFRIIEDLVKWENTTNETLLQKAREEIWTSWRRSCAENADHPGAKELFDRNVLPAFHDPFAGGGALPLEAQRLGLESYASDLNPVAVLINKAMIEIPPKFDGIAPVNPDRDLHIHWKAAQGLAVDVRYYGRWMRDEAEKRIGHLYPRIAITAEMVKERADLTPLLGQKLTVIALLWTRTVKSPNPAFAHVDVPLASTFMLSTKAGKEAYVEPVIEGDKYRFTVKVGKPADAESAKSGTKLSRGGNFQCLLSGAPIPVATIRDQGVAGTMGARLMAIVAEGPRGRVYLAPTHEHEAAAEAAKPSWKPDTEINYNPRDIRTQLYGLMTYGDLFTPRQLVALTTFSDLINEAREKARNDALQAGLSVETKPLSDGGIGASAYAEAVATYLACALSRLASYNNTICIWNMKGGSVAQVFARQAIPMSWDYIEVNPLEKMSGNWIGGIEWVSDVFANLPTNNSSGLATQCDAAQLNLSTSRVISTDPPYYDNIGYADLSDFFYVWLRHSLKPIFPELFSTLAVPKVEELVATPYRHGSKEKAESFFLDGMKRAMHRLVEQSHPAFPVTIYYAYKQAESDDNDGTASTGWDTFLEAVITAGFAISGTWPMRTERDSGVKAGINALASSIVLVCRPLDSSAPTATRREFLNGLKSELPQALAHLQAGNIAPVDLAQAAIGPGMAVYTRYSKVLDTEGKPISVREALSLINQTLDEALAEQEGDFDADSRWAIIWFEQNGFAEGDAGIAILLTTAKGTALNALEESGIVQSGRGKVRLFKASELPDDWDPATDPRLTHWEIVHHLIRVLESGGEGAAAALVTKLGGKAEIARELAYRLYMICERKKRAADALSYNALVQSWPEIMRLAQESSRATGAEPNLFSSMER